MPEQQGKNDPSITQVIRHLGAPIEIVGDEAVEYVNSDTHAQRPTSPFTEINTDLVSANNSQDITTGDKRRPIFEAPQKVPKKRFQRLNTRRGRVAGLVVVTVALGSCVPRLLSGGDNVEGMDNVISTESTVVYPTLPMPPSTLAAETPLFGTINSDAILDVDDTIAATTSVVEPTTIAPVTTIPVETVPPTTVVVETTPPTTEAPSTTAAPVTTIAPTTLPPTTVANPYATLDCLAESTVFERGWKALEVVSNCSAISGLTLSKLIEYNPEIENMSVIITGTRVYLMPRAGGGGSSPKPSGNSFNCAAELGRYYEVNAGESPSSFLIRIITSHGFTTEQARWMLGFNLINTYNLDQGPFLANSERCAPKSDAYDTLFPSGIGG